MHLRFLPRLLLLIALFNATLVSAWHVHHHEAAGSLYAESSLSAPAVDAPGHDKPDETTEAACLNCMVQAQMGAFVFHAPAQNLSAAPVEAATPSDAGNSLCIRHAALQRFAARAPPAPATA